MAVFTKADKDEQRLDWRILRDGSIRLYRNRSVLEAELSWLRSAEYQIKTMDCRMWNEGGQMHRDLASTLSFPAYYGHNLDAFNECLQEDLEVPDPGGLVLVLDRYDIFSRGSGATGPVAENSVAYVLLDILSAASRYWMLSGRRLIVFVQSDDPTLSFERLGGRAAIWNDREWLTKSRGL